MKIKITQKQIIKALYTEPLKDGQYMKLDGAIINTLKKNFKCPVCAVGALMSAAMPNSKVSDVYYTAMYCTKDANFSSGEDYETYKDFEDKVLHHIENGQYLSALSTYFEGGMDIDSNRVGGFATIQFRTELADFIVAHFPNILVLDTDKEY